MVTAVESDGAMSVRRLINQWCNIRTTQVGTLMVTAVVRWCHELKKTHQPVVQYQNYTGRYTYGYSSGVRWCHECKKTHQPVVQYQNYTGRYTYGNSSGVGWCHECKKTHQPVV